MNMAPASTGRLAVALAVFALLAVLVWRTMEPGRYQQLVWLLLAFFALRVLLGWQRARKMKNEQPIRERDRLDVKEG